MALILSIDTAMEQAGVCIAEDERILTVRTNNRQSDHASWLHAAIRDVLTEANKEMRELQAVAVTAGPGSYTGLRVGMASAKGLCYVLNIPLITESTLHLIAWSEKKQAAAASWICPMIDARRMEVFTSVYDDALNEKSPASAMILDEHSFQHILDQHAIVFCGNGSPKWRTVCRHSNAFFSSFSYAVNDLAAVALPKFRALDFADLAYSEPSYLKNIYTGIKDA